MHPSCRRVASEVNVTRGSRVIVAVPNGLDGRTKGVEFAIIDFGDMPFNSTRLHRPARVREIASMQSSQILGQD